MEFPQSLFPGYHHVGPTDRDFSCSVPTQGWGELGRVQEGDRDPDQIYGPFIPLYSRLQERWAPTEPAPTPLLPPNADCGYAPVTESDLVYKERITDQRKTGVTLNFSKQIGRFSWDHNSIAFQCMGRLLEPHCYLGDKRLKGKVCTHTQKMTNVLKSLQNLPYQDCPFSYSNYHLRSLSYFTGDWIQDVPPALMAQLVNEDISEEWRHLQFQASLTGGALSWTPYPGRSGGCLIYPRGASMNQLHFQQMLLDQPKGRGVKIRGDPAVYDLGERIQQVSTGHFEKTLVGVRADFHLATFSFSAHVPPKPLQVVSTKTPSTCINVSPHILGDLCVCTEGGSLYLWNLETGLQRIRHDPDTLFFCDDPHWRWSDFTAHPRVLTVADRTGVQTADIRVPREQALDLFRIGQESLCQRGERVILTHCLRETNPELFLVTTQFSLYIMDERFPLVPLAKWDHMLERPPSYVTVIPGGATNSPNKILLGTQHSQETLMLQYSGSKSSICQLHLPALSLPRISKSLSHLAPLLPHHHDSVSQRLASPLAGLTAAHTEHAPNTLVIFQLTEAGDIFTQRLVENEPKEQSLSCEDHRTNTLHSSEIQETALNIASQEKSPGEQETGQQALDHGPETNHTAKSPHSLSSKSKLYFHRWICDLRKQHIPRMEDHQRPGVNIKKLFSTTELNDTMPELAGMRDCLRESMKQGKLIQLRAPQVSENLDFVCTENYNDPLSQRLTASWEGQLELWWDDHYGLNKDKKIQDLRERRRRHKLQRAHIQRTLGGSFSSSFSLGTESYRSEVSSTWSCDTAALSDSGLSCRSVSEPHMSTDQGSPRSVVSGPSVATSHHCPPDNSQLLAGSQSVYNSSPITSSQSLHFKGIPRERRRTLQSFISHLGESSNTAPSSSSAPPALGSSSQTLSQRSQPPRGLAWDSDQSPSSSSAPPTLGSSSQTLSQRSQPPSKRSRMGF